MSNVIVTKPDGEIILDLEACRRTLEKMTDFKQVKDYHDKIAALQEYLEKEYRNQANHRQLQNDFGEARIWARRRMGEIVEKMPRDKGGRPNKNPSTGLKGLSQRLGVSPTTYTAWVQEKNLPVTKVRQYIEETRKKDKGVVTVEGVRRLIKELERDRKREQNEELVEEAPELLESITGIYPAIVIDPPWDWGDEGDVSQFGRGNPTYATMSFEQLLEYPVREAAEANAHLYLWITNRSLPKGFALMEAWGFRYVTCLTWCKPSIGMGNYFRGSTEHVLFGVRGSLPLLRNDVGTWFQAPRQGKHSTKPDEFYRLVETCSPGPWLEIFSRTLRPGWKGTGAEA